MVTNQEIERLLEGRWKSLTPNQQRDMARELMTYRKARQEFQPGWGDYPSQESMARLKKLTARGV